MNRRLIIGSVLVVVALAAISVAAWLWLRPPPAELTPRTAVRTAPPATATSRCAAGTTFRDALADGSPGPEMVPLPAGSFRMGSPLEEPDRRKDEVPRQVTIERPFAIGKYEITFAEFDRFAKATGRQLPYDQDWGRGQRPVINITWQDAAAYAEWLSQQTGKRYRLPTEAEWEYAARGGSTTAYWWGDALIDNQANCKGCSSRWQQKASAPVGSFPANGCGLHDVLGNVWEWTCSHYGEGGTGLETRCAGIEDEELRVIRGGSYLNDPDRVRAAARDSFSPMDSNELVGFRLAREL